MQNRNSRTSLRRLRRLANPMQEFDKLPVELRNWLTTAALPWAPKSALKRIEGGIKLEAMTRQLAN